jgi:formylglycine-generating enzyme required for sulfatase activity
MKRIFTLLLVALCSGLSANNISVSNVQLTGQNTSAGANNVANFTLVQFNLSWENSWRFTSGPGNWDAAWVFIKYRGSTGDWQHARLNNTGHIAPAGSTIDAGLQTPRTAFNASTNPGIGAFIYRSAIGTGTFSLSNVQLRWNYGANGVLDNEVVDVRVYAIEMVYVPQGSFSVGDGTTLVVQGQFRNGSTNAPLLISSENALTLGGTANGNLANNNASGMSPADDFNNTTTQTLPAAFPKGFTAFYGMKYEISQQGYVDFLNTLNRAQQAGRLTTNTVSSGITSITNRYVMYNSSTLQFRNGIRCDSTINATAPINFYCDLNGNGTGGEVADGQWIACNYLSYMDLAAYLDWSGLRPMTELEFEKVCRGPLTALANEYAWGTTGITGAANITNGGSTNETSTTVGANAVYSFFSVNVQGPMRVGVFATGSSTRAQAGAGYYGMMELSGNLWERPVSVGNAFGRGFTGVHGNGTLSANGSANETAWPGLTGGEVTGVTGVGFRGGEWNYNQGQEFLRVSDRSNASSFNAFKDYRNGGRGVRVSP